MFNESNDKERLSKMEQNNSRQKILTNVEPFSDVFYYTCFFNSLFPAILSLGRSIIPILLNCIAKYEIEWDTEGPCLYIKPEYIKSLATVLNELGIYSDYQEKSTDIIKDIIDSLNQERPVIVWIDCFYDSMRRDLYQKEHWQHSLLFYGYDQSQEVFHIIEHNKRDDLLYSKKTIPFQDVIHGYRGYLENFYVEDRANDIISFTNYYVKNDLEKPPPQFQNSHYQAQFIHSFGARKTEMLSSLNTLHEGIRLIHDFICDEMILKQNCSRLVTGVNDIVNDKTAERYLISCIFDADSREIALTDRIIDKWKYVRALMAKYLYSGIYKPKSLLQIDDYLQEINQLENEFYQILMKSNPE